ncbi:LAQU0S09e00122g1_1 [Lachancea quebecensis]|uniref:LAQU0S09e00122g1_1 n=1 Tax=Lachancea quebecensis TaxID=1654605 RepID=A0A0P1KT77_9SACH|nr:LAQU0S09e00122g1_1 [Lachancea quebecensis]
MARDNRTASVTDNDALVRRRRRKIIKSCTFCRQRKLKCDHKRPKCGSCLARKIPECIYMDTLNLQLSSDELYSNKPNVALLRRIQELELELDKTYLDGANEDSDKGRDSEAGSRTSISSVNDTLLLGEPCRNRALEFNVLHVRKGQFVYYGPTSIRATISASGERFVAEYSKFWDKVKSDLASWRTAYGRFPAMEHNIITAPQTGSVLESIIIDLPYYEVIGMRINEFFDDPLHDYFRFLDKQKVLGDFARCFVPGYATTPESNDIPKQQVIMIAAPENKNFYTIGVVLMILCLNHYKAGIPLSIERFIVTLEGFTTANSIFVERAQFLLLVYIFRVYNGMGGNGSSNLVSLVSLLTSAALRLGLHKDIDIIYAGQEHLVGSLCALKNLWYWTLFADLCVAFDMGILMNVTSAHFDDSNLPTSERGRIPLLRNFLFLGRKCMQSLLNPKAAPDLHLKASELISFVESQFRPIRFYTNSHLISQVDLFEVIVLSPALAMITNFFDLMRIIDSHRDTFKEMTVYLKNKFVKCMLVATSLTVNTIIQCYKLDKERLSTAEFLQLKHLTPWLNLCVLLLNSFPIRVLTEMYALMLYKISLFEKGQRITVDKGQFSDFPSLDDLSVPRNTYLHFKDSFETFCATFDELWTPENTGMIQMLLNSHYFVIMMALERVNRKVFQLALQSRTEVEKVHDWPKLVQNNVSDDVIKMLADEVWNNYSTGLSGLTEMPASDFLANLEMPDR